MRLAGLWLGLLMAVTCHADTRVLLQLVDYVGVDYPEAVADGQIINAGEYAEMEEFAGRIATEITALEQPADSPLAQQAQALRAAIDAKAPATRIAALTQQIREQLMADPTLALLPDRAPDLAAAAHLYQTHCAVCHGPEGRGDGPAAGGMEPAPTNFRDVERASQRSLFGLYNTVSLGVDGTGMTAFPHLSDHQRWSLAFLVGGLFGESVAPAAPRSDPAALRAVALSTPAEWTADGKGSIGEALWYRQHPTPLFSDAPDPLLAARQLLAQSLDSFRQGDLPEARQAAIAAYLDGFELAEASLSNVDGDLLVATEQALMAYREALGTTQPVDVEARYAAADRLLTQAQSALEGDELAPGVAFVSSLIILLREGLEAMVVLAAMITFLVRTGHRHALRYVHAGWIAALLAGGVTWAISTFLITIGGATREITEGVTALLAAAVLFYVGFWMHGAGNAKRWNDFLQARMQAALDRRALWTLTLLAFLAVYREVFETVLFYQALWSQAGAGSGRAVIGGASVAVVMLLVVTWLLARFGLRLPLRQLFLAGGYLMVALAVIFAGKGVAAMQEAGQVPLTGVGDLQIGWLGIYPTAETVGIQLLLLLAGAGLLWRRAER